MRLVEGEFVNAMPFEIFPGHAYALVRLHLFPPSHQIGFIDRLGILEIAALSTRVVALAKVLERRIELFQTIGQLGIDLQISLRFAHRLNDFGTMDVVMPLVPGQAHIMTFEVGGNRQQDIGPQPGRCDG